MYRISFIHYFVRSFKHKSQSVATDEIKNKDVLSPRFLSAYYWYYSKVAETNGQ